jgi:hypothetical protein
MQSPPTFNRHLTHYFQIGILGIVTVIRGTVPPVGRDSERLIEVWATSFLGLPVGTVAPLA